MGVLRICDDVPQFDDVLSPTALTMLRDNLLALDEGTRMGGYAFCGLYGQHPEENDEQHQVIWRGGGIWVSGMTTLRVITWTKGTLVTGDTLRVYRGDPATDGTLPGTYHDLTLTAGSQTHAISLSGAGYADGDAVRVTMEVRHASDPPAGYTGCRVEVVLAELTPVGLADAAPTLPTFGSLGGITATTVQQLADYVTWLIRRVATRYDPLFILQTRRIGPFCIPSYGTDQNVVWWGGIRRTTAHTTVTARGKTLRVWGGATESVRLWVGGSVVSTHSVPTSIGESTWTLTADISGYSVDTVVPLRVDYVRTAPEQDNTPINRWTIDEVSVAAASGGAASLGAWDVRQASVSGAALLAWFQAASTLAQACYNRIAANGGFWASQRLFTARPAFSIGANDSQFTLFEPWSTPGTWRRTGEALAGRGRALTLGYSAGYLKDPPKGDEGVGAYVLENVRTTTVVDGDRIETFVLYLDSVPALPVGAPYNVRGVESYVLMERLKVVED